MNWLLAFFARLALLVIWVSTPLVNHAFHEGWLLPLLGILFLPLTALVYVLVFALAGEVVGWNWLWVVMALLLDLATHSSTARQAGQSKKCQIDLSQEKI